MVPKIQSTSKVLIMEHLDQRDPEKRDDLAKQLLSFPLGDDLTNRFKSACPIIEKEKS